MTFRVGQKVVCVDDSGAGKGRLQLHAVYTVSMICPPGSDGCPGIRVIGAKSPNEESGSPSFGWKDNRFRPVVESKTDISIFTEILRKASKPARGPAFSSPHHPSGVA